jgi:hypothetical protein
MAAAAGKLAGFKRTMVGVIDNPKIAVENKIYED